MHGLHRNAVDRRAAPPLTAAMTDPPARLGLVPTAEHVRSNRDLWDRERSRWFAERARTMWAGPPRWGLWQIPQTHLPVFPDELAGLDTIELGCGTGYVSSWLARAGARPVGLDSSTAQLDTARAMQDEFDLRFPLVHADAEQTPFDDAGFDLAISEHGASGWCDPYRWIPEAARLLRPGGQLVFVRNSTLLTLCCPYDGPAGTTLLHDQFGLNRMDDPTDGSVTFQLPTGPMIRLLRDCGLVLDDLIEVQAPAAGSSEFDYAPPDWSRRWPSEEVWKAHKPR